MSESKGAEKVFKGIAASPGLAHGPAFVFLKRELEVPMYDVAVNARGEEIKRFEAALARTREQIIRLRDIVSESLGETEAGIFDAHLLVLEDKSLINDTLGEQVKSSHNIDYCFHVVSRRYIQAFSQMEDEYMRERSADIRDVTKRVLTNLLGGNEFTLLHFDEPKVVISEDISPSDAAEIHRQVVLAIVTNSGSRTSHSVIMARSMQVPAVVGMRDITEHVSNDDYLIVDGYEGLVIVNPTEETLFRYGQVRRERLGIQKIFESVNTLPAKTKDGQRLQLMVNIEGLADMRKANTAISDGIGLFRTEALFLKSDHLPTEEEQFKVYQSVAEGVDPLPVIIRTLDLGGDKKIKSHFFPEDEPNPFMGCRAIRLCFAEKKLFKGQLRAILRASVYGNVRLMYPMINSVDELLQANEILEEAKAELRAEKIAFNEKLPIGSMIETPAAAMTVDLLAEHCSFFSLGTNDLVQYVLAVDRVNDRIAHLYQPHHPAVIRLLKIAIETAHSKGVSIGVCGEMSGDPLYVSLLLGLGVDSLSLTPSSLPEVKYLIRNLDLAKAKVMAKEVLQITDPVDVLHRLRDFYFEQVGDLLKGA